MKSGQVSTVFLQVVGSGSLGAARSLYVFTDHCRYLFNCGEGTQRLTSEHKMKLSAMEHVFITQKTWENVGGLPGALLTLQESGVANITLHGPPGLDSLVRDTKNFMRFNDLSVNYQAYESVPGDFCDGALQVKAFPLLPKQVEEKNGPESGLSNELVSQQSNGKTNNSDESKEILENDGRRNVQPSESIIIAYVCQPTPKPGALLPTKCRELGVPSGPLMGELKRGQDVQLPSGKIVKSSEVTKPPEYGPAFLVVDIPSEEYIESLVKSSFQEEDSINEHCRIAVVVHFSAADVVRNPAYRNWLLSFPSETSHIYINEYNQCMGSESVHRIQYKLNHIYPRAFPLLSSACNRDTHESSAKASKRPKISTEEKDAPLPESSGGLSDHSPELFGDREFMGFTGLAYHIRPHLGIDKSKAVVLDPETYIKECYENEDFGGCFEKAKLCLEEIKGGQFSKEETKGTWEEKPRTFPRIVLLGTGSCIPNKFRNTSGILLDISDSSAALLDCGEGTLGQLVRLVGSSEAECLLRRLSFVYISHLHADHHIGLIRVLIARRDALLAIDAPVTKVSLLAPAGIQNYLKSYDRNFERILDLFHLIPNNVFLQSNGFESLSPEEAPSAVLHIRTCFVRHCPNAFGVVLTLRDALRVAYSGDTMPCDDFVEIGMGSDVLIHEATMEDDLKEDAVQKRHSTMSEAIQIGVQMKARYVILTHFSQRYNKVPLVDQLPTNVSVAFDNMIVDLLDLPLLPHLYPVLLAMFEEDVELMMKKREKYKAKVKPSDNKIT